MNALSRLGSGVVWMEVTPRCLHVLRGETLRRWPLERTGSGGLAEASLETLRTELPAFLGRKPWHPRWEARCALPASGVTLRRWKVPRSADDALRRVLALQIESEFPLAPEELAWGWTKLGDTGAVQDVLVAAVRRTALMEWAGLLRECGLTPRFTVSALARTWTRVGWGSGGGAEAWLDLGAEHSEWLVLDGAGPARLRVLPWGEQTVVDAWKARAGVTAEVATGWLDRLLTEGGVLESAAKPGWDAAISDLAARVPGPVPGGRIRLTGRLAGVPSLAASLAAGAGGGAGVTEGVSVDVVSASVGRGWPAAIRGMHEGAANRGAATELWLAGQEEESSTVLNPGAPRKWAAIAALLLLGWLSMPYLEALVFQPGLSARVQAVKARQDRLKTIDRHVDFLRHLRQNQTPYLETLLVLGKTAPQGAKLESLDLNRKGEMALRISMRQPQQVTDFRSKLTDSGFFTSVVIEEQSPTPNRQQIQVRIRGQIKPANLRQGLKILAADESPPPKPGGAPGGPGPLG